MQEITHPHNDTLKAIDGKIARLFLTYEHINQTHKNAKANNDITRTERDKWFKEISDKIMVLSKTKNLLLEFGVDVTLETENLM